MTSLWHLLTQLFSQKDALEPSHTAQSDNQGHPHDLGHASKCVWELDKEA